jgi:ABC-type spermidine/putrescine transport system permease subunit II
LSSAVHAASDRAPKARGSAGDVRARLLNVISWVLFGAVYVFLYAPLVTIGMFAFNDSRVQSLPWAGFTLRWFAAIPGDESLLAAVRFGFTVSAVTVVLAGLIGTAFAVILHAAKGRVAAGLQAGLVIPVVVPGMVLGLSLAIAFRSAGLSSGLLTVVIGHLTFTMPVVALLVLTRLNRMDPSLAQASMDLGAGPVRTFRHVTWPQIRTAVGAACLLTLTLSFDEVIVTYFLVGTQPTLPVFIWGQTRFGFTPEINAIVTLIGTVSIALILIAGRVVGSEIDPGLAPVQAPPGAEGGR